MNFLGDPVMSFGKIILLIQEKYNHKSHGRVERVKYNKYLPTDSGKYQTNLIPFQI